MSTVKLQFQNLRQPVDRATQDLFRNQAIFPICEENFHMKCSATLQFYS